MLDYDLGLRGDESLYDYLYQRIRDDIASGELREGARLPSKRALAEHLGVSVVTVEGAYRQLVVEGYVESRPRSGYFVCDLRGSVAPALGARAGVMAGEAPRMPGRDEESRSVDFALGARGAEQDAASLWTRALRQALASESEAELFAPAPAKGTPRLREAIASHLRQTRGMVVDPENVVVGAGAQILDSCIVQLLGRERAYGVEDPGYPRLMRLYAANGVEVRHVPIDEAGVRVDALAASDVGVMHVMPSHQFPTGCVTSIGRRYELLGWAADSSAGERWIIEDDYDCEFRLAGRPVPALASVDAMGRVIYTNTFSKSLGSALRLAYMVLPDSLMERYTSELGFYSSTVSTVDQVTLARILEDGSYERHVARVRKRARDVRDRLREMVAAGAFGPGARLEHADAGLHCVLAVPVDSHSYATDDSLDTLHEHGFSAQPIKAFTFLPQEGPRDMERLLVSYC
ncbi:PLP-dependent aminotransferase family protein [uncultured Parolsenella sp.]|uniref:MocR-like pyridoxine biosynthesis transcription factor PdxR n=1 Tax=uncultured Parolsenella sp. TaxID=2083008 RepID=UPI0025CD66E0|nr:PLP-dependent aminotransferase family protein [uncultured Parolsenella sp.]